ncbi:MAG: LamG domain-containing protein [Verrucomicrobiales bacterium]|nr:LamG domain-containing protein [Verrucomicrobiales bacterium]
MDRRFLFLLIVCSIVQLSRAAEVSALIALQNKFEEKRDEIEAPLENLASTYEKKLNELKDEVQQIGDLKKALAVQKEISEFRDGKNSVPKGFTELVRLRSIYDRAYTNLVNDASQKTILLTRAYVANLQNLQMELTREGKLEEALAVKKQIDSILISAAKSKSKTKGDLIGHWTFDEDGRDSSGMDRHAMLHGGASIVKGKIGSGSLKVARGQFAEVVHHSDFNLDHPFTVALWIYREPGAFQESWGPIFTKGDGTWRIQANDQGESVVVHLSTFQGLLGADNPSPLEDGEWYHIAAVFTGTAIQLYVDGRLEAEQTRGDQVSIRIREDSLRMGNSSSNPIKQFNGRIDDVRIYKKVLKRGEIQSLMRKDQ